MQPTSQKSPPQNFPEQTCGQRDSHVRIFQSAAVSEGLTEQEADSFLRLLNSSKAKTLKIDPHGLSLKMLRISCPFMEDGTLRPFSILYNLNGFYKDLKALLNHMIEMGLSSKERQEGIYFAESLEQIKHILSKEY